MIEDILNSWIWLLKLSYGLMQLGFFSVLIDKIRETKKRFLL